MTIVNVVKIELDIQSLGRYWSQQLNLPTPVSETDITASIFGYLVYRYNHCDAYGQSDDQCFIHFGCSSSRFYSRRSGSGI